MSKELKRRDFLKGGLMLASGGVVAALAQILGCKTISFDPTQTRPASTDQIEPETSVAATEELPSENSMDETSSTAVETDSPTEQAADPTAALVEESQTQQPSSILEPVPGEPGAKFPGRVVQISANTVHNWDYSDIHYWDYVDQDTVNKMVDRGVMTLTGTGTMEEAWRALIPHYQQGQVVAIKVSFNNSRNESGSLGTIDGIIEPVNSVIRGLNQIGVPNSSIVVYDSSRWLPQRFIAGCDYPGVVFRYSIHDPWGEGADTVTFNPPGLSKFKQKLSKEVVRANYLINVPVLKWHGMTKLSLAMKNHYGSIEAPKDLHQWSTLASSDYTDSYNPMVDLNNTPHIRDKTVLTIGDSIFGAFDNNYEDSFPRKWITWNNQTPKSLFFSTDPVAIDCVMGDMLYHEFLEQGKGGKIVEQAFSYLALAEEAGLGVYERGNPRMNTYSKIEFILQEL